MTLHAFSNDNKNNIKLATNTSLNVRNCLSYLEASTWLPCSAPSLVIL